MKLKNIGNGCYTDMHTDTEGKAGDYDDMQRNRIQIRRNAGVAAAFIMYIATAFSIAQCLM